MENDILVTDWEQVREDDFYLKEVWAKRDNKKKVEEARDLQRRGYLYYGYVVDAKKYALHVQMDSQSVLIDNKGEIVIWCESSIIGNNHRKRMPVEEYWVGGEKS